MSRERGLLSLAALLTLALGAVTFAQPGARELTTLTAPTGAAAGVGGERLARAVRYAELQLPERSTLRVDIRGAHGGVLLSLVDDRDRVREVRVTEDEAVGRFGAVEPGAYSLRVLAAPPEPPQSGDSVTLRVTTGGRPWALFAVAVLLILAPPLVLAARKRSTGGDGEPTNR